MENKEDYEDLTKTQYEEDPFNNVLGICMPDFSSSIFQPLDF